MAGIRRIRESNLHILSPFYQSMLRSYAYLNNLFYEANTTELLPRNIWLTSQFPFIDKDWHLAGINTLSDLPLANGKIVISYVWDRLLSSGAKSSCYLWCCVLQEQALLFCLLLPSTHLIHLALLLTAKSLVQDASTVNLSLQNWEKFFDILPLE